MLPHSRLKLPLFIYLFFSCKFLVFYILTIFYQHRNCRKGWGFVGIYQVEVINAIPMHAHHPQQHGLQRSILCKGAKTQNSERRKGQNYIAFGVNVKSDRMTINECNL